MNTTDRVAGEGGDGALSQGWFDELVAECENLRHYVEQEGVARKRDLSESVRYAQWENQSFDERMYRTETSDMEVLFDGQSDIRLREADQLVREQTALDVISVLRADMMVTSRGPGAAKRAALAKQVLGWVIKTVIGDEWLRQWILLSGYRNADEPAAGLMMVDWRKEKELEPQRVTIEEAAEAFARGRVMDAGWSPNLAEEELALAMDLAKEEFASIIALGEEDEDARTVALEALGRIGGEDAELYPVNMRRAARDLLKEGEADVPREVVSFDGPVVEALRLWEDAFIPPGTTDFERCPYWFRVEWVSAGEAWARVARKEWRREFVIALVGEEVAGAMTGGFEAEPIFTNMDHEEEHRFRGRFQVATAYFRAVNKRNVAARYTVTFRPGIEKPAHERRLLRTGTRGWPAIPFTREALTKFLIDSRGIPWIAKGMQGLDKRMLDLMHNAAALGALPPLKSRNRRGSGDLFLEMLGEIPLKAGGDVEFLDPPAMPKQVEFLMERMDKIRNEYFGRSEVQSLEGEALRQLGSAFWLSQVAKVMKVLWQECQYRMSDEMLEQVTDGRGEMVRATRDEIAGQYYFTMNWDPRELDPEYLEKIGDVMNKVILPMDRANVVDSSPAVRMLMERLMPAVAVEGLRDADRAQADEVAEEMRNYALIRSGVRPPLVDDGSWNYELRAGVYRQMQQENPAVFEDMAEDKRALLAEWLQSLDHLARQYGENVDIGRSGAKQAPAATMPAESAAAAESEVQ